MQNYTEDYLLDKKIKIFQPVGGYRASTDAVLLSSFVSAAKTGQHILDVGSGTGAISLCLAERFKNSGITVTGVELQPELAQLSGLSTQSNGFDFVRFLNVDIRRKISGITPGGFQHVITNPPYAGHDMASPNRGKALAHNREDISLSEWINFCIKMTAPKGCFYTINRAEAVAEILAALHGKMGSIRLVPLYSKAGREAKRVIVSARKDSKAPAIISPGFVVHEEDGSYTPAAQRILRDGLSFDEAVSG